LKRERNFVKGRGKREWLGGKGGSEMKERMVGREGRK